MIRLIKKKAKSIVCSVLAAVTLFTMNPAVFATETATQTDTVSSVDVSGSDSSDAADKSNTDTRHQRGLFPSRRRHFGFTDCHLLDERQRQSGQAQNRSQFRRASPCATSPPQ